MMTTISGTTTARGLYERAGELTGKLAPHRVITDLTRLRSYECDGITGFRVVPALVALPESTRQVATVVAACARAGVRYVARGASTGLSGGALPVADGMMPASACRANRSKSKSDALPTAAPSTSITTDMAASGPSLSAVGRASKRSLVNGRGALRVPLFPGVQVSGDLEQEIKVVVGARSQ